MRASIIAAPVKRQAVAHPSKSSARSQQLSLLKAPIHKPVLSIAPVPDDLALGRDRYYIQVIEGFDRWYLPLQLRLAEAQELMDAIARSKYDLSLMLSPSGVVVPVDYWAIASLVESAIDGGANG